MTKTGERRVENNQTGFKLATSAKPLRGSPRALRIAGSAAAFAAQAGPGLAGPRRQGPGARRNSHAERHAFNQGAVW